MIIIIKDWLSQPLTKMYAPTLELLKCSETCRLNILREDFAKYMDECDPLKEFRNHFLIPKNSDIPFVDSKLVDLQETCVYLCGHSLGLQPKSTKEYVNKELEKWATKGVCGHVNVDDKPWWIIDEFVNGLCAQIVGAKELEVVAMNGLTVNIHLLLVPFYRPTVNRHKILVEGKSFPSDYFALESHLKLHGYDPATSLVEVNSRQGETFLRTEDIIKTIEEEGESIALIWFGGLQYYTGQLFDMKCITEAGHKKGCIVGFDLAHAVGNVELSLHDWGVDFACWCSYKYLNSGPGALSAVFIHERHAKNFDLPRLEGWWGHEKESRFQMDHKFLPRTGAAGFQISNPPVLQTVSLLSALELHTKATMKSLRKKSQLLTGYMEYLLMSIIEEDKVNSTSAAQYFQIITPKNPCERGAQLSIMFPYDTQQIFLELKRRGVVVDERKPNVIRVAAAPIYNSFMDVFKFYKYVKECIQLVCNQ
ncbi:kynureninase-like isoform X2 [Xenia sp. Carnegie-2017]|uniref:kynureninase-like isoform X2 n=1 Tax=Xenia sp. Carnegie-2017 TaxID=2897299 RepID=UPI001F041516|nr:kynureninase-like isoform X2 [Xenia sp. Carnegie-2017]